MPVYPKSEIRPVKCPELYLFNVTPNGWQLTGSHREGLVRAFEFFGSEYYRPSLSDVEASVGFDRADVFEGFLHCFGDVAAVLGDFKMQLTGFVSDAGWQIATYAPDGDFCFTLCGVLDGGEPTLDLLPEYLSDALYERFDALLENLTAWVVSLKKVRG